MGLGPFFVWRNARIMQKDLSSFFLCKLRATWDEVGLCLLREMVVCFTHFKERRWSTACRFRWLVLCQENQFSICWERMSGMSWS